MIDIRTGDCRTLLGTLPPGCVQACVTSPPYFGLRDYGVSGQLGLEATPDAFVAELVEVLRGVRRVLRDDGTLWLNLGDSYATGGGGVGVSGNGGGVQGDRWRERGPHTPANRMRLPGLKKGDLIGIPWRVAFALQADGWTLRRDIVWQKTNPMPESIRNRPTTSHEYVFLLTKGPGYFYDGPAIREPCTSGPSDTRKKLEGRERAGGAVTNLLDHRNKASAHTNIGRKRAVGSPEWRNARSVWTMGTSTYRSGEHFATMPVALAERCILAGSRPGDLVLDPFGGAGTTGLAALRLGRRALLLELNPAYAQLAHDRIGAEFEPLRRAA